MNNNNALPASIAKVAAITLLILIIPFTASLITDEMAWSLYDFLLAGVMLFGTGSAYVLISRQSNSLMYRVASGLTLVTALFLVWINLAVGVIGPEDNAGNLMYYGVILILMTGILAARFRPRGMANALFTAALAQAATVPVALARDMQSLPGSSVMEIILVNGMFVMLFALSGVLFLQATRKNETPL